MDCKPRMVVRVFNVPVLYMSRDCPEGCTEAEAEAAAAGMARKFQKDVWLLWPPGLEVWFDAQGRVVKRTETGPRNPVESSQTLVGGRPAPAGFFFGGMRGPANDDPRAGREGFWIEVGTGKAVEIDEHCRFAAANTETFGLAADEVAGTGYMSGAEGAPRLRMLKLVMSKGWIRMRRHRDHVTFEYKWDDDAGALSSIKAFIASHGKLVWPGDKLVVYSVGRGLAYSGDAAGMP